MTLEQILHTEESSTFDRKSLRVEPKSLAQTIVAMANSDGGDIVIGLTDAHRHVEGIDYDINKLNEILRTPIDFCIPSVPVRIERVPCTDVQGRPNHLLVFHIEASPRLHTTQADEAFIRVGDRSRKLSFDDRLQLMYDKGLIHFEETAVERATIDDLDLDAVADYCEQIGYGKSVEEFLRESDGYLVEKRGVVHPTVVAILLFGKKPQDFMPRAYIRFIRYDGTEEKTGAEMNVIKDVTFYGTIRQQIDKAVEYLTTQISEHTYLGSKGLFVTDEEYPAFVRQEIIVNAACHRDYSIYGTDIQVKMFTNRLVVESPGTLPGRVRPDNIRHTHFSRNPKIAQYLKAYKYVKEFGEGVDRMCRELEAMECGDVRFRTLGFLLQATAMNKAGYKGMAKLGDSIMKDSPQSEPLEAEKVSHSSENEPLKGSYMSHSSENEPLKGSYMSHSPKTEPLKGSNMSHSPETEPLKGSNTSHSPETEPLAIPTHPIADFSNKEVTSEIFMGILNKNGYKTPLSSNLMLVFMRMANNEVFGIPQIVAALGCSYPTAKRLLGKLRELDVVVAVRGNGKGRYMFKELQ